jgi:hypothetical protein
MATVRNICDRALRRIRVASAVDSVSAEDASIAVDVLNSLVASWATMGVQPFYSDLALTDRFTFYVPPLTQCGEPLSGVTYYGAWDATLNDPVLRSGVGDDGDCLRVSVAGATDIDGEDSWAIGDYVSFVDGEWRKTTSDAFLRAVIDLLALELCNEFGKEPTALLVRSASDGWSNIQAACIAAPAARFDAALTNAYVGSGVVGALLNTEGESAEDPDVYLIEDTDDIYLLED